MKIGLTYDLRTDYSIAPGEPEDALAEFDSPATIEGLTKALEELGHQVIKIGGAKQLLKKIGALSLNVVFNLAEGGQGRNRESWAPIILELKKIPFIGSDGICLAICLDKLLTKKILTFHNINTPAFIGVETLEGLKNFNLKFPVIVKPRYEGSGKGISINSIVKDKKSLRSRVKFVLDKYKQPVLIEEFIKGSEFTIAIIGNKTPEVFPVVPRPVEQNTTLSMHVLEKETKPANYFKIKKAVEITPELENKLKHLALEVYKALGCFDFARVDFRLDEDNNPFVLEINPLPNLSREDTFGLLAQYLNINYRDLIHKILTASLKRWEINGQR